MRVCRVIFSGDNELTDVTREHRFNVCLDHQEDLVVVCPQISAVLGRVAHQHRREQQAEEEQVPEEYRVAECDGVGVVWISRKASRQPVSDGCEPLRARDSTARASSASELFQTHGKD